MSAFNGSAGGIWLVWDIAKIEVLQLWCNEFSISVKGHVKGLEVEWLVTGVYDPCLAELKSIFFEELAQIRKILKEN